MKRKIFFKLTLTLLVFAISSTVVFPAPTGDSGEKNDKPVPYDYSSEDFYKNADYDDENIDWDIFDQSKVPKDRIADIPAEHVDPTLVTDTSQLTKDQLAYTPSGGEPNINKVENWQALDPKVRDEVLSEVTRKDVATTLTSSTSGRVTSNGFVIDNAESIRVGYEAYTSVTGFEYKDGRSSAKQAETRSTPDSTATNNREIEAYENRVSSSETESFSFRGINIRAPAGSTMKDATFETADNGVRATLPGKQNVEGNDASGNEFGFEGSDGSIAISLDKPPLYKIKSGIFNSPIKGQNDLVHADTEAVIEMGTDGIRCVQISPVGTYRYENPNREKDFAVNIPEDSKNYKLCLRKLPGETFIAPDGVIDFPAKEIQLLGIVNYMRYPFDEEQGVKTFVMQTVYEGENSLDKVVMVFDESFLFADIKIENPNPEGSVSTVRSGSYEIIEQGTSRLQKIHAGQDSEEYPDVFRSYSTSFSDTSITINPDLLIQEGGTSVKVASPGGDAATQAGIFLRNYWNRIAGTLSDFLGS